MFTLIVDCNGFPLEHHAYITDGDGKIIGLAQLPVDEIAPYVNNDRRISKVVLSGPTEYCLGLKDDISENLSQEYSIRNVEIEVI